MDFVLNYIELQSIRPPHVSRDEYRRFVLKKSWPFRVLCGGALTCWKSKNLPENWLTTGQQLLWLSRTKPEVDRGDREIFDGCTFGADAAVEGKSAIGLFNLTLLRTPLTMTNSGFIIWLSLYDVLLTAFLSFVGSAVRRLLNPDLPATGSK